MASYNRTVSNNGGGDVKFLVGSGLEQETVTCDKRTLVASSPKFAEMVSPNTQSELTEWIQLPTEDPTALKNIIKCIKDETAEPPMTKLAATYETARRFQIPSVAKVYRQMLLFNVDRFETAVEMFETGTRLADEDLRDKAIHFLTIRANSFIKSDSFKKLSKNGIIALLKCEKFIVESEYQVFSACHEWAKSECIKVGLDPNNFVSLNNMMKDVLPFIRFPIIPEAVFKKYVEPLNIVEYHDVQLLSHYWTLKNSDPLSAEAMELPFPKQKRIGTLYQAIVFDRKPLENHEGLWTVPEGSVASLKFWSDCSVKLHYLNLFGKPTNGKKTGLVALHLFEKLQSTWTGGAYHIKTSQTSQAYLKGPKMLTIEFNPPLYLKAGLKHYLDIKFLDFGLMDDSMGKTSGNAWKLVQVPIDDTCACDFLMKKVDGQDCLPMSVDFTVAYLATSSGPTIDWSSRNQPRNNECKVC